MPQIFSIFSSAIWTKSSSCGSAEMCSVGELNVVGDVFCSLPLAQLHDDAANFLSTFSPIQRSHNLIGPFQKDHQDCLTLQNQWRLRRFVLQSIQTKIPGQVRTSPETTSFDLPRSDCSHWIPIVLHEGVEKCRNEVSFLSSSKRLDPLVLSRLSP
jgi:hypothetical protein